MRGDRPGAVVILECRDIDDAKTIMAELPLVKEKFIEFDFIPLSPFTPFASLFGK
jgi:predicted aconitase with swiveling domain